MKATLSWDEFLNAYYELASDKQPDPGIQRLYAHLGKGSVYLISKYKARLKELKRQALPLTTAKVPDPISAAAARLWQEIEAGLQEKEAQLEQAFTQHKTDLQASLDALKEKAQSAEQATARAQHERDTLNQQLIAIREEYQATTQALNDCKTKLQARNALVGALEKNLQQVESSLTATLEHEREQAVAREQALNAAQASLQQELLQVQTRLEAEKADHQNTRRTLEEELRKMNVYYAGEMQTRDARIAELSATLDERDDALAEITGILEETRTAHTHCQQQLSQTEQALAAAQLRITQLEKDREALLAAVIGKEDL